METFDVALWVIWPFDLPHVVEFTEASSYVEAIEQVMRQHDLFKCARAAVALCGGSFIARYHHVLVTAEGSLEGEVLSV